MSMFHVEHVRNNDLGTNAGRRIGDNRGSMRSVLRIIGGAVLAIFALHVLWYVVLLLTIV